MKNFICLVIFFVGIVNHSFSQSKKKQIEALNHRLDSVMRVVQNERETNSQKVSTLELKIGQLKGEISNMQETIRQNERIIDEKDKAIQESQKTINALKDSMSTLQMELTKLKPAPIEEVKESIPVVAQSGNYKTVSIGSQVWMTKNLDVETFRNGDPIPHAKTEEEWKKAAENKQPAWCYYDNDPANGAKYGKLYNWYAVNDPRGLAPAGYHVPSDAEWEILENHLGGDEVAGKKMKSKSGWESYEEDIYCSNCKNWNNEYRRKRACDVCKDTRVIGKKMVSGNGTNSSGFSGLPGGYRNYNGTFYDIGTNGYWWSSTEEVCKMCSWDSGVSGCRTLTSDIRRWNPTLNNKEKGLSVRCLRD
ncbi:MAG: FISUMP domain-containing protein [Bacteroidia bacterium]